MDIGFMRKEKKQLDKAKHSYEKAVQIEPNLIIYDDIFVSMLKGVIHVGANIGQERELYATYGLNVIWIEPFPEVYNRLKKLIHPYPEQRAFCYLITDVDDNDYSFHISNNEGLSSSIYDLGGHKAFWPNVTYIKNITLKSITLPSLVKKEHIELTKYDALVLDTQGSELLVLKGAVSLLPHIKYVKAEVADFESYKGCCQLHDIDAFLKEHHFRRIAKESCAQKEGVGSYYEVLYISDR
jgi:FkbM family methyltransferase